MATADNVVAERQQLYNIQTHQITKPTMLVLSNEI